MHGISVPVIRGGGVRGRWRCRDGVVPPPGPAQEFASRRRSLYHKPDHGASSRNRRGSETAGAGIRQRLDRGCGRLDRRSSVDTRATPAPPGAAGTEAAGNPAKVGGARSARGGAVGCARRLPSSRCGAGGSGFKWSGAWRAGMKHLIVGAGATLAEALALGNPREVCPPLICDFARKMWANYSPHPFLEEYLKEIGHPEYDPRDPRILFYELEERGIANIERFMEFVWNNRDAAFPISATPVAGFMAGLRILQGGTAQGSAPHKETFWDDFQYHGIGNALVMYLIQCFHENGVGIRDLKVAKSIAKHLQEGDLVLNLNYDTIFEIALSQIDRAFCYAPGNPTKGDVLVCKPHGSINLVVNDQHFTFGQPEWWGTPQPPGYRSFAGFVPPRLNKSFEQHPIAKAILGTARNRRPHHLIMWGVGLTDSDADLVSLYAAWSARASVIDIINPSAEVAEKAELMFKKRINHYVSVDKWNEVGSR